MPLRAQRPCSTIRCAGLTRSGRFCTNCLASGKGKDPRPSASQRDYGAPWRKLRATIPRPALCENCHAEPTHTLDHKIPRGQPGGTDHPSNLWWLGKICNGRKLVAHDGAFGNPVRVIGSNGVTR
jgi:5-methylcytosine-specific restriction endonuclease McrA